MDIRQNPSQNTRAVHDGSYYTQPEAGEIEFNKNSTDLAFFIQSYKSTNGLMQSVRSLKAMLPNAPVYLLSDGGEYFSKSEIARKFNIHTERAPFNTHLADYMNSNFTCSNHLQRLTDAAGWAKSHGAHWIMLWEEDTRMLGPPRHIHATVGLQIMGNMRLRHCCGFAPEDLDRSWKIRKGQIAPRSERDAFLAKYVEKYAYLGFYSGGPLSTWRIDVLLDAFNNSKASDEVRHLNNVQDVCWTELAVINDVSIQTWKEAQESVLANSNTFKVMDSSLRHFDMWCGNQCSISVDDDNFKCLQCLDSCKHACVCGDIRWSWGRRVAWAKYSMLKLFAPLKLLRHYALQHLQRLIMDQECGPCSKHEPCFPDCQQKCYDSTCPAMVHKHKKTTFDCNADRLG